MLSTFGPGNVLDVGALNGADALKYARAGEHLVHSFEPTPAKRRSILRVLRAGGAAGTRVELHAVALSDATGEATLHEGMQRAADPGAQDSLLPQPYSWGAGRSHRVRKTTLDAFVASHLNPIERLLYAKIDTQGHDPQVCAQSA